MNDDIGRNNNVDREPAVAEGEINEAAESEIESKSAAGESEAEAEVRTEEPDAAGEEPDTAGEKPDDGAEEDWDEDAQPVKPWAMTLVFLGLIAAAAVICVIFWNVTHADKPDDEIQNTFASAEATGAPEETAAPQKPNQVVTKDGRIFEFTECDDYITPKEYVNLRTEPSTEQGDATVSCTLNAGQVVHRTGDSGEMGWSRVEYNGQTLYVVTSNMNVVTE